MALFDDNELIKRMQYLEERKKERKKEAFGIELLI